MDKVDGRKLTRQALEARRGEVIRLYEGGVPVMQIASRVGLGRSAVNAAIKKFESGGVDALAPTPRGRKTGTGRTLTEAQEAEIRHKIVVQRPMFYGFKKSLWDRDAVAKLIESKCRVKLSERSIGSYLIRWGMTLRTRKLPAERCSPEIRKWLEAHLECVKQQAKKEGVEIYWANKTVKIGRPVSPSVNKPPIAKKDGSQKSLNMTSVVSSQGKLIWALGAGTFSPKRQRKFLEALVKDTRKAKLVVIRHEHKAYSSQEVLAWLQLNASRIQVLPVPGDQGSRSPTLFEESPVANPGDDD